MSRNTPETDDIDLKTARRRGRPVQMCRAQREALVLDCAIGLLSENGPEDVTMDRIAQRAGMSKRTLYALCRSKEELLGAGPARMASPCFARSGPTNAARPWRSACAYF